MTESAKIKYLKYVCCFHAAECDECSETGYEIHPCTPESNTQCMGKSVLRLCPIK